MDKAKVAFFLLVLCALCTIGTLLLYLHVDMQIAEIERRTRYRIAELELQLRHTIYALQDLQKETALIQTRIDCDLQIQLDRLMLWTGLYYEE